MHPTLFSIGKWSIPSYSLLLMLGSVLGLVLTYLEGKRLLGSGEKGLDLGLWALVGGVVAGRFAYVVANWRVFAEDWARAIRIWEGGLSFHGAFLGGFLALVIFARVHSQERDPVPFWRCTDTVTVGLALSIAFGWAACLMGGCAYGLVGQGIGTMILPDLFGVEAPRFATQIAGLVYSLALFVGFCLVRKNWPFEGAAFLMFVLFYFAGMFFLEFARGDEAISVGRWRLTQAIDVALALSAAVALLVLWRLARRAGGHSEGEHGPQGPEDLGGVATPVKS
jgi:phosphatidylglycerol:prolipoprotein diacylglycerol transferase